MPDRINQFIKNNYGSRIGLLRLFIAKFKNLFGAWRPYKKIDWQRVDSLVFICMGNICRSPLGEAVAKYEKIPTRSYGLTAPEGDPADPRAIEFAESFQIDLTEHSTTPLLSAKFESSDLVIVMEPQHFEYNNYLKNIPAQKTLLGLWHHNNRPYLHDPYNTNETYFSKCEVLVIEATKNIVERLKESK